MRAGATLLRLQLLAIFALLLHGGEARLTTPFIGVTHIERSEDSPRKVSLHIVKIDLTAAGISFKLTAPGGSRETVRQTTLDFQIGRAHV